MSAPSIYMIGGHVLGNGGGIFATPSSGGGTGFFSDPYPTYTQFYVSTTGNDSWTGTTPAFVSGTTGPKLTPQAGANVALASINSTGIGACCNIQSGTYNVSSNITIGATTGTSPTAQLVIRGLPSYTSAQMPLIIYAPTAGFYINGNNNAVANLTIWKIEMTSNSNVSNQASVGIIQFLSQSAVTNLQVMFCKLHDIYGTDLTACIHAEGPNSTGMQVGYTYMYNVTTSDGSTSDNGACILEYQIPAMQVFNCDFTGAPCLIYFKRCPPSANGPSVTNCFFHNYTNDGVYLAEQGAGDSGGFLNCVFSNNLFLSGLQGIRQNNTQNTAQSNGFTVSNNTFADMTNCIAFAAMTGLDINSNVMIASGQFLELQNPSPLANGITRSDYNAYQSTPQSWYMDEFGGGGAQDFTSLVTWQTAFSVSARPELTANPDTHATTFTPGSISTNFPGGTSTTNTWGLAVASVLRGTGLSGVDPGYVQATCGTLWS